MRETDSLLGAHWIGGTPLSVMSRVFREPSLFSQLGKQELLPHIEDTLEINVDQAKKRMRVHTDQKEKEKEKKQTPNKIRVSSIQNHRKKTKQIITLQDIYHIRTTTQ